MFLIFAAILTICGCFLLTGCSGMKWSVSDSFYNNLIAEDRYRMILTACR